MTEPFINNTWRIFFTAKSSNKSGILMLIDPGTPEQSFFVYGSARSDLVHSGRDRGARPEL